MVSYSSSQKILLVGEGDFSFSASLAISFGSSAPNIVATSLDSQEFLRTNYKKAMDNIAALRARCCVVLHELDATTMACNCYLSWQKFDRIVFNFPFAGFFKGENRESQIRKHQNLIRMFMENAKKMITETGEIHITHKTNRFHSDWDLVGLGGGAGLKLIGSPVKFNYVEYSGYNSKLGFGGDGYFNCNPSSTFRFGVL